MSRGLILCIGLLLLAGLCWYCIDRHAAAVEADLAMRAQQALAAADVEGVQVRLDGRDAVLTGQAPLDAARQQAVAVVQGVHGVRSVENQVLLVPAAQRSGALPTDELGADSAVTSAEPDDPPSETIDAAAQQASAAAAAAAEAAELADAAAATCQLEFDRLLDSESVQFESSAATIKAASYTLLDQLTEVASTCPSARFEIAGHTDSSGGAAANKRLSERRASAVRDYLIEQGIDRSRLSSVGYGEEVPRVSNDTPAGRAQNRRVELVVEGV